MKLSLAIITKNRQFVLLNLLASLLAQTEAIDELLIIDNASTDNTWQLISNLEKNFKFKIKAFYLAKASRSQARNLAIKKANYQWLAFIDDDCILDFNWLTNAKKSIQQNQEFQAILGNALIDDLASLLSLVDYFDKQSWINSAVKDSQVLDLEVLDTKNIIYNRRFLIKHNIFFDSKLNKQYANICEDSDLGMQMSAHQARAHFAKDLIFFHQNQLKLNAYLKKTIIYTTSHLVYQKKWQILRRKCFHSNHYFFRIKTLFTLLFKKDLFKMSLCKRISILLILIFKFVFEKLILILYKFLSI